jgi:ArsR family transcriptional regulator
MSTHPQKYEARAEILKAMAHPGRLKMLDALGEGERCVSDLQALVGSDLSTISRHLSVMRAAGLLSSRKRGNQVYYALRVPCVLKTFRCIDAVLLEDARSARKLVAGAS